MVGGGKNVNSCQRKSQRIPWIDITKGLLILCLVYGHHKQFAMKCGMDDEVINFIQGSMLFYASFFMQTFFIITGLCSTFSIPLKNYVWKNVKTLVIPAILLSLLGNYVYDIFMGNSLSVIHVAELSKWFITGAPWFIMALFWAKLAYWFIAKQNTNMQIAIVVVLYFIGLLLDMLNSFPNYMYHRHTLLLLPYLFGGVMLQKHFDQYEHYIKPLAIVALVALTLQTLLNTFCGFPFPVHDANIGISFKSFPLHVVNVVLGTSLVFYISQKIAHNNFLQVMGKGTLLVYLLDVTVENMALSVCSPIYNNTSLLTCVLFHGASFALSIVIFYLLIRITYSTKYLSWIVGKW